MAHGDPRPDRPMPPLRSIAALDELTDEPDVCLTLRQLDSSFDVRAAEQIGVLYTNGQAIVARFLARRHAQGDRRLYAFNIRLATRRYPVGGDRFDVQPASCSTGARKRRFHFADRCEMHTLPGVYLGTDPVKSERLLSIDIDVDIDMTSRRLTSLDARICPRPRRGVD